MKNIYFEGINFLPMLVLPMLVLEGYIRDILSNGVSAKVCIAGII